MSPHRVGVTNRVLPRSKNFVSVIFRYQGSSKMELPGTLHHSNPRELKHSLDI